MMGLKFERTNELDKLFDSFAVDPKKQEMPLEELKKQQTNAKKEKEAGQQQAKKQG